MYALLALPARYMGARLTIYQGVYHFIIPQHDERPKGARREHGRGKETLSARRALVFIKK
jgi:hypothetical protein